MAKNKTKGWLDSYQEGGVESRQAGYTDIPFNYNSAWGGQFAMGGSLPDAQKGIACPKNVCGPGGDNRFNLGLGKMLNNIGDFLGVGEGDERKARREERRRLRKENKQDEQEYLPEDQPTENLIKKKTDIFRTPSYENMFYYANDIDNDDLFLSYSDMFKGFGGFRRPNQQNMLASYSTSSDNIVPIAPQAKPSSIYNDGIVSRYISPEMNTPSNILSGGREFSGVPISGMAMMGASIPGSVGFTYARTQGIPSEGPYAKKTLPSAQNGLTFLEPNDPKLPSNNNSSEVAISIGGEDGEPALLIPSFKYGQPILGPSDDPYKEFLRTGDYLGGPFKTWQEADEWERDVRHPYVEKGQSIPTPLRRWGKDFENGGSMTYYQHGLDWKPRNISRDGSEIHKAQPGYEFLSQKIPTNYSTDAQLMAKKKADAQALELARKRKLAAMESSVGPARQSTAYDEQMRAIKNRTYQAQNAPYANIDKQGNLSRAFPNVSMTGVPDARTPEARFEKGLEHMINAGMAAGVVQGLGHLGKAGYNAARAALAESMESGLLSNTYKLNPWAFKPQEGMMYRGLGKEGMEDAIQSGVFRPKQYGYAKGRSLAEKVTTPKQFGSTFYAPAERFEVVQNYGPSYLAEVPFEGNEFARRYGRKDWSWSTPREIPIEEGRILQKDWLRGYKEVPKPIIPTSIVHNPVRSEQLAGIAYDITHSGSKVGELMGSWNPEKNFITQSVEILPEFQGKGIGKRAYEELAKTLPEGSKVVSSGMFNTNELGYQPGKNLWESLVKSGKAVKLGEGNYKMLKKGGVIKDDRGQWAHPGEITEIQGNTMATHGYGDIPLYVIPDVGEPRVVEANTGTHTFPGATKFIEIPMMQRGGTLPPIYTDDPRKVQAYQDSLALYNASNQERVNNLLRQGFAYDTLKERKQNYKLTEVDKKEYQRGQVNPKKGLQKIIQLGNDGKLDTGLGGKYDTKAQYELMHGRIAPTEIANIYDTWWRHSPYLYNSGDMIMPGSDFDKDKSGFRKNPNYGRPNAIDKDNYVIRNFFGVPIYDKPVQPYILEESKLAPSKFVPEARQQSMSLPFMPTERGSINLPDIKKLPYVVEYTDPRTHEPMEQRFLNAQEADPFFQSVQSGSGTRGYYEQKKNGGWLNKYK